MKNIKHIFVRMKKFTNVTEKVDGATGEITTVEKSYTIKTNEDKFFMVFHENFDRLLGIKRLSERQVLDYLCSAAEFDTGKVNITPSMRKEICEKLKIGAQTFTNAINTLRKIHLISGSHGDYMVNPDIFWKGSTKGRRSALKNGGFRLNINFIHDGSNEESDNL